MFLLAACAAPGKVKNYNETTQANFIDKCVEANGAKDSDAVARDQCTRWYDAVKAKYSFDQFKKLDADLRAAIDDGTVKNATDLQNRFPDYYNLITTCCNQVGPSAPTTTAAGG